VKIGGGNNGLTTVTLTTSWQRFAASASSPASDNRFFRVQITTSGDAIDAYGAQSEEVSGRANQNPSEYVSVGVLSTPFHGTGVDGVKVFTTQNGNTVASNVVTEATGAAISEATTGITQGYLAEGQRQNLCLWSEEFDATASSSFWTNTNITVTTATKYASPDGRSTAELCTEGGAGNTLVRQSAGVTVTAGATYAVSCFFKNGTGATWLQFRIQDSTGTDGVRGWFNLTTGEVGTTALIGAGTTPVLFTEPFANGWFRFTVTGKMNNSRTLLMSAFTSADANGSTTHVNGATYYAWGAQVEDNVAFPSSYIPTTTTAVTRNADVLSYATAGNYSAVPGTAYVDCRTDFTDSVTARRIINTSTVSTSDPVVWTTANQLQGKDGTNFSSAGGTLTVGSVNKIAHAWTAASHGVGATNGTTFNFTGTYVGSYPAGTTLHIGDNGGTSAFIFGTIRNVRLYNVALSSAQLAALTT